MVVYNDVNIMPTKNNKFYSLILVLADILILFAVFTLAYVIRVQYDNRPLLAPIYALDYFQAFLVIVPIWVLIFATLGLYSASTYNRRLVEWGKIALGAFLGILVVIGWEYVSERHIFPARLVAVYSLFGAFFLLVFEREVLRFIRGLMFRFGRGINRVLIVGNSPATRDIADNLSFTHKSGYKIVAIAGPARLIPPGLEVEHFSSVESALKKLHDLRITTIIQTDLYESGERNQRILSAAQTNHIAYSFVPGEPEFYTGKNTVDVFLGYPMISVSQTPLVGWGDIAKRIFDVIVTIIVLVVLSPLFLAIVILQKIFNPGPIFYQNKRLTRHAQPFGMYKFRSMKPEYGKKDAVQDFIDMGRPDLAEEYEKNRKILSQPDPRITAFGHFIRKTSIDELPQLINVLRGELSLVGPRPIEPVELPRYKGRGPLLLSVRSGMTGLWQVSGRNDLSFEQRVELELYYAQNWSFWLDLKIIMKTPKALLGRRGVPNTHGK
jgi:exopolysaccharide biosynthesis polyprenyl glycosylphosphotransferase